MSELAYAQREIDNLLNLLADARTENMRLRATLEPFAIALQGNWSRQNDRMEIVAGPWPSDLRLKLRLADFRNARAALEGRT